MDTIVEAAIHAFEQGWAPIPISKTSKRPTHSDWTNTRYKSRRELESAFKDANLGVLLGDPSGGLIDIDLDSRHAQSLADGFLPATRMMHGRESSPRSHYWYQVTDWEVRLHKFADPTDGEAMVEMRGKGGQTILPPSVHPSGEQYEWFGGEWHPPHVVKYEEIAKQVRWLAAAALLAKHWPGEGHRHDAALALAGGVLRIGDAELERDAEAFVASVALAGGDEEGYDRQVDVSSTRKLVQKDKKVRGWPSLSKIIDKRVVKQVIEWLTPPQEEQELSYGDGRMTRGKLDMALEIKPHPMVVPDLIYSGKVTWLQGEPGGGKTIFALWLVKQAIEGGHNVMFVDEESGEMMTSERLSMLGAEQDLVDKHLFYYPFPGLNVMDSEHRQNFNGALSESKPTLLVFDSLADVLIQAGLKENENDDINKFVKYFVDPLRQQNVAIVVIDHMTKANSEGSWARGAGSKKSKADAAWTFTAVQAFDKEHIGRVSLKRAKDRLGQLPQSLIYKMGGDNGRIVIEPTKVAREVISPEDSYAQRIIEYLREHANSEETALKVSDILSQVTGKRSHLLDAMGWLTDNVTETPLEVVERGNSRLWFYAGDLEIDWGVIGD